MGEMGDVKWEMGDEGGEKGEGQRERKWQLKRRN